MDEFPFDVPALVARIRDDFVVPVTMLRYQEMEIDVVADNPGLRCFIAISSSAWILDSWRSLATHDSSYIFISQCFTEPELWSRCCAASH
jgi:hypothetical protein